MTPLLINVLGAALIGLIAWWFWIAPSRKAITAEKGAIDIVVEDGLYTPDSIDAAVGQLIVLRFTRRDPSPCAEKVLFDTLGLSADLTLNQATTVSLTIDEPGEYEFTCQMAMYRGMVRVR